MPVQGLPRNAEFLTQIADLGFRLPHRSHRQTQFGGGHFERPAAFSTARPCRRQACNGALGDLCRELGITRQTLYRHISPKGDLRPDGAKLLSRT